MAELERIVYKVGSTEVEILRNRNYRVSMRDNSFEFVLTEEEARELGQLLDGLSLRPDDD